jgi:hypothetical protein
MMGQNRIEIKGDATGGIAINHVAFCLTEERTSAIFFGMKTEKAIEQKEMSIAHADGSITVVNEQVLILERENLRAVMVGHRPLIHFDQDDAASKRFVMATLARSGLAKPTQLAQAFGCNRLTVYRVRERLEERGLAGMINGKAGPKGPWRLKRPLHRNIVQLHEQGLPNTQIAVRLGVSESSVRLALKKAGIAQRRVRVKQSALSLSPGVSDAAVSEAEEGKQLAVTSVKDEFIEGSAKEREEVLTDIEAEEVKRRYAAESTDRSLDRAMARLGRLEEADVKFVEGRQLRFAGVMLAIPMLAATGLFEEMRQVYGRLRPAFYGLRASILVLAMMAMLRIKRVERLAQEAPPEALGRLVGLDRAPEVKTLRRKLSEIAGYGHADQLVERLGKHRAEQCEDLLGFLYVDGHVRAYYGKNKVSKGYVSKRRLAMSAVTDYWVNDEDGQPLLVISAKANEVLATMLLPVLEDVRGLIGNRRATVVFDRGGWSPKLFRKLLAAGFDFMTYRKGKKRSYPLSSFKREKIEVEGRQYEYELCDRSVNLLKGGPRLRCVAVLRKEGGQTHIITSRTNLAAAHVALKMFNRWRQENFFKYMQEQFAIDALVDYGVEVEDPERSVPNPQRKRIEEQLKIVRGELKQLEQHYGEAAADNMEAERPTMRGFKIAHGKIGRALRTTRHRLLRLRERLRNSPKRVALREAMGKEQMVRLAYERKHFTDAIKISAYLAESALLQLLTPYYARCADEGRALLRQVMRACGDLEVVGDELRINLEPMTAPRQTRAIASLCQELNQLDARFPETPLRMRFAIEQPQ